MKNMLINIKRKALSCLLMASAGSLLSSYTIGVHGGLGVFNHISNSADSVKETGDKIRNDSSKAVNQLTTWTELLNRFMMQITTVIFLVCIICIIMIWKLLFPARKEPT